MATRKADVVTKRRRKRRSVNDSVFWFAMFPLLAVFLPAIRVLPYPVPGCSAVLGICVICLYAFSYLFMVANEKLYPAALLTFSLASCVIVMLRSLPMVFLFLLCAPSLRFLALREYTKFKQQDLAKHLIVWTSILWFILFLLRTFFPQHMISLPYKVWILMMVGVVGVHLLPDW